MAEKKLIMGGVFATHTEVDEDGKVVRKDDFHLRLYWHLWHSGAIKKLKGYKLHVLLTIAMHCDNNGQGWPGVRRIGELLGINKDTVSKAVNELIEDGFIERTQVREGGKFGKNVYALKLGIEDNFESVSEETVSDKTGHGKNVDFKEFSPRPKKSDTDNIGHGNFGQKEDMSISQSVSQSDSSPESPIQKYWQRAFKENLNDLQLEEIMSMGVPCEKVIEIIRQLVVYTQVKHPFKAVARAVAAEARGQGYKFNEEAGEIKPQRPQPEQSSKSQNRPKNTREENIPQVLKEEMEKKENNSTPSQVPAVDPETRARIMDQLNRMRQRMNQRMNEGGGNLQ